ncbi:hypothetical protein KFE25_011935 [Diacronema lutheri]|uniref:HIT-type domain-containing protein n=1 Tax=Diacronema lutheri TaxID=2081491 RepID=A0A8J5X3A2_DIALT|nr:hypothetical protein KFE25_011935 [Diacronema lutheri]
MPAMLSESPPSAKRARAEVACAVCAQAEARYRCPRCEVRTCSARCVAAHKTAPPGCSGKRDVARYSSLPHFDDALLLSDYRFLEEAGRSVEAARREAERDAAAAVARGGRGARGGGRGARGRGRSIGHPTGLVATPLSAARAALLRAATARGIHLRLMASGMSRAAANTSRFVPERHSRGGRGGGRGGGGRSGGGRGGGGADVGTAHGRAVCSAAGEGGEGAPASADPTAALGGRAEGGGDGARGASPRGGPSGAIHWRVQVEVCALSLTLVAERAPESVTLLRLLRDTVEARTHGAAERRAVDSAGEAGDSGSASGVPLPTMSAVVQRHRLSRYVGGLDAEEARTARARLPCAEAADGRVGDAPAAAAAPGLALLLRDEGARSDLRGFFALPLAAPLGAALRGCVVVEFPTLFLLTDDEANALAPDGAPVWPRVPHPAGLS